MPEPKPIICSFCGKTAGEVLVLIAGPGSDLFICDCCVKMCDDIVLDHRIKRAAAEMVAKAPTVAQFAAATCQEGGGND